MPTTVQHIKGSELPPRLRRPLRVRPERTYTLTIEEEEEPAEGNPQYSLMDLFELKPGAYENPRDIDEVIRKERDSWGM